MEIPGLLLGLVRRLSLVSISTLSSPLLADTDVNVDAGIKVDDGQLWCDPVFRRDNNIIASTPALVPKSTEIFTNVCSDVTLADGEELRANCGSTASLSVLDLNKCIGFNFRTKQMEWVSQ